MFGTKNYATIVAPLKKMASDLTAYIEEQKKKISNLENEKSTIEFQIYDATDEIAKSNFTTGKINELIVSDIDENNVVGMKNEIPDETPEEDSEVSE